MKMPINWKRTLSVACPVCGAQPGEPCHGSAPATKYSDGYEHTFPMKRGHRQRIALGADHV